MPARLCLVFAALLLAGPGLAAEPGNPLETIDRQVDRTPQEGVVREILEAGGYTYLWVEFGDDERWVVSMRTGFEADSPVRVKNIGRARVFHSRRLDRTFDELWFATVRPL